MTEYAAIKATFSEWRMVKGRKVLQLVMEVPLEQQGQVFEALGAPMPDTDLWVGIARLNTEASQPKGGKLAQRAGILCQEKGFETFCAERYCHADPVQAIYEICGVTSRTMLDHDDEAAARFHNMIGDYNLWLKGMAA